ncbi:hypothetical protein DFJ73DRAFT_33430 [Zopfochytrium polystomum]|nr:hypothetical protein DFJ73DRAFT_33430 [Zopfochytrium polystomum]
MLRGGGQGTRTRSMPEVGRTWIDPDCRRIRVQRGGYRLGEILLLDIVSADATAGYEGVLYDATAMPATTKATATTTTATATATPAATHITAKRSEMLAAHKFIAISHLWGKSTVKEKERHPPRPPQQPKAQEPLESDGEEEQNAAAVAAPVIPAKPPSLKWTIDQDANVAPSFHNMLLAVLNDYPGRLLWLDYACVPQALHGSEMLDVFVSMSIVYSVCFKCVAVPLCTIDNICWKGEYDLLRRSLFEADKDMRGESWTQSVREEACNVDHCENLKAVTDKIRVSNVSISGWSSMGYVPYKYMLDLVLVMYVAGKVLQSEYFSRVWTFQEMILPTELVLSFGEREDGTANLVDVDAFLSLVDMAVIIFNKIVKAMGLHGVVSPAFSAYLTAITVLAKALTYNQSSIKTCRRLGRQSRYRIENDQLDAGYIESVLKTFAAIPRQAEIKDDYVYGLLGIIPVRLEESTEPGDHRRTVNNFFRAISRKTRRIWTAGGFIRAFDSRPTWWTGSIPKGMPNSTFLRLAGFITDYDPSKPVGEEIGTKTEATNLMVTGRVSIRVRPPDTTADGEASYPLRHDSCSIHRSKNYKANAAGGPVRERIYTSALTRFLHSLLSRTSMDDHKFVPAALILLGMSDADDGAGKDAGPLRSDFHNYFSKKRDDKSNLSSFVPPGSDMSINMYATSSDITDLFGLPAGETPLVVDLRLDCGCHFGLPHELFDNLSLFWPARVRGVLNLASIEPRGAQVLQVMTAKVDLDESFFDRFLADPDKEEYHSEFDAIQQLRVHNKLVARVLRETTKKRTVSAVLTTLRNEKDLERDLPLANLRLYERGGGVYAVRGSLDARYFVPVGLLKFTVTDLNSLLIKKEATEQAAGNGGWVGPYPDQASSAAGAAGPGGAAAPAPRRNPPLTR